MLPFLKTKNRRLPLTRFSMTALPLLSPILPPPFLFSFAFFHSRLLYSDLFLWLCSPLLLRLASFYKKTRTLSRSETVRVSLSQIMFSKISLSATSAMNSLFVGFSVPR